jgi:predicted DNA-binding WGR domain protein
MIITPEMRRAWGRIGGKKRAQAFTREFQRAARACVSHESNVANGRLGGKAYVQRYGMRRLVEQARAYRFNNPSNLEKSVEAALIELSAIVPVAGEYEREAYLFPNSHCRLETGDFVFRSLKPHRVIYADGNAWHNGKKLHPSLANCADRRARDKRNDNYLLGRGWSILRLTEAEIKAYASAQGDNGALVEKLRTFFT